MAESQIFSPSNWNHDREVGIAMKSDEISSVAAQNLQQCRGFVFSVSVTVSSGGSMAKSGGGYMFGG
ncbi:hypothetical protein TIFTF001_005449 [Ficus carica]|uniref:Uncharacterized protein n=1 Tax=Ficus carica TaxID=3494 RepID=A0AA88DEQ9_FICCA|nr:hypothetical protein TIFTF001_005449 [Ficus carica]